MLTFTIQQLLAVLGVLVVVPAIYNTVYNLYISPLKKFPGPVLWRITKLPYLLTFLAGNKHKAILALHDQYGPIVRFAPTEVSYLDDIVWKDAWGHRQGHDEFTKDLKSNNVNGTSGILTATRANHSRYRRLLSHAFSAQGMREQEPRITHYIDLLIQRLREHSSEGPQDMVSWFNWTTFDLIGDLSFGESFDCLEESRLHPWIAGIFGNMATGVYFHALREYGLVNLVKLVMPKRLQELRLRNYQYASEKVRRRVKFGKDRGDFLDNVLKRRPEDGGMRLDEIESTAGVLVLAGSETTATLLSGLTYALLKNPDVLAKLQSEVRSAFTAESEITMHSTQHLKYLNATLDEGLRYYPPVPTFAGRIVPPGGDTVGPDFLPAGTTVHAVQYAMFRSETNFHRASEFLPERWLGDDAAFANDNRAACMPFAHGPRNCIGKNLAYAEMRLIVAKVMWNFDMAKGDGFEEEWIDKQKTFILWEKSPLLVNLTPRT